MSDPHSPPPDVIVTVTPSLRVVSLLLFKRGMNTAEIADHLNERRARDWIVSEAEIYNSLARPS